MKKLILTIVIVLGLGTASFAQNSLFNRDGNDQEEMRDNRLGGLPNFPDHGETGDGDAPLTGGALLLIGFGAAYAMNKRSKK